MPAAWRRAAEGGLLSVLAFAALRTLYADFQILRYPFEANFGEGGLLYDAVRIGRGQTIYAPASSTAWISPYPPLYALVVSLWPAPHFLWPRLISQVAQLVSGLALAVVLRRHQVSWPAAVAAALLWIANPFTRTFAAMGRVDMLGRMLESLTMVAGVCWGSAWWGLLAAAAFSALAMTTKQTMFAGALALAAWWWFQRARRRALWFAGLWLALTAICYAIVIAALSRFFLSNVFFDVGRSFEMSMLWPWLLGFLTASVAAIALAVPGVREAARSSPHRLYLWAAVAGLPSVLLAAQDGADVNYFFDFTWPLCALAALGLHALTSSNGWRAVALPCAAGAIILLTDFAIPPRYPSPAQRQKAEQVRARLAAAPKPVLSEFLGFGLAVGSEPDAVPYLDKKLEEAAKRSTAPLAGRLRRREFGAVLITSQAAGRWSPAVLQALDECYRTDEVYGAMFAAEGEPDFAIFAPGP
jgi:hypothetical protein